MSCQLSKLKKNQLARGSTRQLQSMTVNQLNRLKDNSSILTSSLKGNERGGKSTALRRSGGRPGEKTKISKLSPNSSICEIDARTGTAEEDLHLSPCLKPNFTVRPKTSNTKHLARKRAAIARATPQSRQSAQFTRTKQSSGMIPKHVLFSQPSNGMSSRGNESRHGDPQHKSA